MNAQAQLLCPACGTTPDQRIDSTLERTTVASCVCRNGHLFVTEWEEVA